MSSSTQNIDQHLLLQANNIRKILRSITDIFYIVNTNYDILFANESVEKLSGYTQDELIGKNIWKIFEDADLQLPKAEFEKALTQNIASEFEMEYHDRIFHVNLYPSEIGLAVSGRDVTEKKKIIEQRRTEEELIKSLKETSDYKYALDESSIVAITDQKGIIKHVNDNFCKISKYSREELLGQDHRIINSSFHPKEFIRNIWVTIANGNIWKGELKNKAKDGSYYWVDTTIVPFLNDQSKPYQYVAIRADITERKLAEEEIKILNEQLEERVRLRTAELEALNQELESFSYSISHDLRAPLRAINGYSFRAQKMLEDRLTEDEKNNFDKIISNTKRMGQLIDDLLSFSRLGRKEILKFSFSMPEVVNQILRELSQESIFKRVEISMNVTHSAPSDLNMLKQVWVNLIDNAIKYSSKNNVIEIELSSFEDKKNVTYFIKDNGVGFDMEYSNKLFGVFQRLHDADEFQGVGVGLAIIKKIITKHGGKVWAEGKVGEGAVFYFSLPKK